MKKIYLICNAHIDPIWQWTWDEGISAAIATFKSAADLAEEFDYIFCHGESLLYEAIEKNAPDLFKRIQALVRQGKWKITSGWYLQPDCVMPSGESIVRQIKTGERYFKEKFGIDLPKVATGYDAFGHNIGLTQILKKCGHEGYIVRRPLDFQFEYEGKFFNWIGPDGSKLVVSQTNSYASELGNAIAKILRETEVAEEVDYVLWGVGNHGGGPSRKDLKDIENLRIEGVELVHGTPEMVFFDAIKISGEVRRSLTPCMPGCYSSMARIKQAHRETENLYYAVEKMLAVASFNGYVLDSHAFEEAEKRLLLAQFHDILPGTSIEDGEKEGLELLSAAKKTVKDYRTNAFLYFVMNEKKAGEGEYPIFVFNYTPYEYEGLVEVEFSLADQNWSDEFIYQPEIYDEEGNKLLLQQAKEESTLNLDWRKRIIFEGKLKPLGIMRFTVKTKKVSRREKKNLSPQIKMPVQLIMYDDTADPWAMSEEELSGLGKNPKNFRLMTEKEVEEFCAVKNLSPVHTIEDGDLFTAIEEFVCCGNTSAVIEYKQYKNLPYTDIKVTLEFADKNKLIRLKIPTSQGKTLGDGMYAVEEKTDGEIVFQKWLGREQKDGRIFAVLNDCAYAGKADEENLYITLVRGAGYCFHPIPDRSLYPEDRYLPRIDCGRYVFTFRLYQGNLYEVCQEAELFNQRPYAVNVFPTGEQNKDYAAVSLKGNLLMPVCKALEDGKLLVRIYNPQRKEEKGILSIGNFDKEIKVGAAEVVSVLFKNGAFEIYHTELPL